VDLRGGEGKGERKTGDDERGKKGKDGKAADPNNSFTTIHVRNPKNTLPETLPPWGPISMTGPGPQAR